MRDYIAIANQYIDDVLSGEIAACEFVKLACERQRRDLALENFRYRFDEDRATHVCKFIELLPHTKGKWARERKLIEHREWNVDRENNPCGNPHLGRQYLRRHLRAVGEVFLSLL